MGYDLNDNGEVVGRLIYAMHDYPGSSSWAVTHAFYWKDGQFTDLESALTQDPVSYALAINAASQVVVRMDIDATGTNGYMWEHGVRQVLPTLGGTGALAMGINDHGEMVGGAATPSGVWNAALWLNGSVQPLGSLLGPDETYYRIAQDINNDSVIVGHSQFDIFPGNARTP